MTTSIGSSRTTPVIVSGDEDDDASIYLRVCRKDDVGGRESYWCVIKTKSDRIDDFSDAYWKEVSDPVFKQEPNLRRYSGCVFVGGTLYALGGRDSEQTSDSSSSSGYISTTLSSPCCDVFYIDTTLRGAGWKKLDHSMNAPRWNPHAFTLNCKIYVMGGNEESLKPEVLDTRRMEEGWRELQDTTDVPRQIDGHAVIDGGKRIVVKSLQMPHLYCYDVDADSWEVYRRDVLGSRTPAFRKWLNWESTFLDGILYYLDQDMPGLMFGVDVSSPHHDATTEPKRVSLPCGSRIEDWEWEWIPQRPPPDSDLCLPHTYLVSLGSGKLAVLWYGDSNEGEVDVYCSTLEMSKVKKKQDGGGDDFDLVARPLSLSHVLVHGSYLENFLPLFPFQTTGPQEEVNKEDNTISAHVDVDDSTISANHKNSTGGSNNKKNMEELFMKAQKKKNMQKKGRMRRSGHEQSKSTGNVGARIACGNNGGQE